MDECINHRMNQMMSRILEIRYTDLDEEKMLCEELLRCSEEQTDLFGKAFALTYLGDYYIAVYEAENAGRNLLEAEGLFQDEPCWDELRLRCYSLLGIYYDIGADEQNAIEYYLKAISFAEKLDDMTVACVAMNNLAYVFQRHHCLDEALEYYMKAYELQASLKECPIRATIVANLAEALLNKGRLEEARRFILECEEAEKDPQHKAVFGYRNWCGYYCATGEKDKALAQAEMVLQNKNIINEERLTAFEAYHILCQYMLGLGEAKYTERFLQAMEECCKGEGLDQIKALEELKIQYTLTFEPEGKHAAAYRRVYEKNQKLRKIINKTVTNAMKSKIQLEELMEQRDRTQTEQETLEKEINVDELTGAYSRSFLWTIMRGSIHTSQDRTLGVVMLDVDYFKEYNDYYGHMKGDVVLQEVADCLKINASERILPCRYGGDEFVCICDGVTEEEIEKYIRDVRVNLAQKALHHDKSLCSDYVTLSIGYALGDGETPPEGYLLLQLADQALYESKRSGRNTYTKKELI